ncbi:MAG: hypothetical protein IIC83_05285 [Chloroflexi bacterium]|nr:hypothetical protein [Chloroflexota bacterium]
MRKVAKKAFVLMPFDSSFDSYYADIFKPALENAGYDAERADDLFAPRPIMEDIRRSILHADLLLCEMSGQNPNVFYELGLAHAIGRPAILVSQSEQDIPFDLRHIRVILYDYTAPGWDEKLRAQITESALSLDGERLAWPPPLTLENTLADNPTNLFVRVGGADASKGPGVVYQKIFYIEIFSSISIIVTEVMLDGVNLMNHLSTKDQRSFLLAIDNIRIGNHSLTIQAVDFEGAKPEAEFDYEFTILEPG